MNPTLEQNKEMLSKRNCLKHKIFMIK